MKGWQFYVKAMLFYVYNKYQNDTHQIWEMLIDAVVIAIHA